MQKSTNTRTTTGAFLPSWIGLAGAPVLRRLCDALLSVVLAPACAACGALLEQPTAGPVCPECWRSITPLTPPLCARCADPLPTWRLVDAEPSWCSRCQQDPGILECARAVGTYDGALSAIVHALKYDGRRSLARPLAAMMRARGADVLTGADCVVPVPLHPSRRRARGFNQAADLARHLELPVVSALRRTRATETQTSLPAAKRHANVRGAFVATRRAASIRGCTIVLIDDVTTTGATLEACARALKEAGVGEVRALTAARVVARR